MVSDRQNKIDYSLKNFSEKIIKAANIVSINKKNPNKIEYSPFGNRYKATKEIHFELKQAKSAIDGIPNNDLSKSIAKETLVTLLEESGNSLVKNNHELGHLLTASAKKFSTASQISDLFEFVNYVSKDKMEKANEKLADISGGFVGAYVGAKIGARRGNFLSVGLGAVFGAIGGTKDGRELLTRIVSPSKSQFKQGEFDNLEKYAVQAEKMKQEMSIFNDKIEKNSNINSSSIIFDTPTISQDGTK